MVGGTTSPHDNGRDRRRPAAVLFLPPTGQGDHHDVLPPRLFANPPASIVPVQLGHADVEQDHFGPEGLGLLDRRQAVVGQMDVVADHPQHLPQAVSPVLVVVNHQDPQRPARLGGAREHLHLRVARVGAGDDRNRPDLAMLGIEHDALAKHLQILVA